MKKLNYFETVKQGLPFEAERFRSPDNCFYPIFAWVWNDVLSEEQVKNQIDRMYGAGIRVFYVIPEPKEFRPNSMITRLEPDYLSDEFMAYIKIAADHAAEKGMYMWLYDEGGWPSGNACGQVVKKYPEAAQKVLTSRVLCLKRGEAYIPAADVKAAFNGKVRIYEGYVPEEDLCVTEYFIKTISDFHIDGSDRIAVERFLELTHEQYKKFIGHHFGKTVPFMFTDEPSAASPMFPTGYEEKFREKFGYDILDKLPAAFGGTDQSDEDLKVRRDFITFGRELYRDNFFAFSARWCEENGIMFTGHLDNDHRMDWCVNHGYTTHVDTLSKLHVPGVDVIVDQVRKGRGAKEGTKFFPRIAPSAAAKWGGNLTLSESFGVYGSGLTPDEIRYIENYQFVRGINLINFMTISYSSKDFLAFAERPSFSAEKPGYEQMRAVNDYTARMSYLTSVGGVGAETLLYFPMLDLHMKGEDRTAAMANFNALGEKLENMGVDFHICDDYSIREGEITENGLKLGDTLYKYICVPENKYMPEDVKMKIAPFMGEPRPVCHGKNGFSEMRAMKRVFENGDELYFFFNEGDKALRETFGFFSEKKYTYELEPCMGEIFKVDCGSEISVMAEIGECKCYLRTNTELDFVEDPKKSEYDVEISLCDFEISKKSQFYIDMSGSFSENCPESFSPVALGPWKTLFGEDFSGEAVYRTEFELDFVPRGRVLLSLGKAEHSVSVTVNGSFGGYSVFEPYILPLDSSLFRCGKNVLELSVANTAANQFVYTDVDKKFRPEEIGPYNERSLVFEKEHLDGGLYGPVTLKFTK